MHRNLSYQHDRYILNAEVQHICHFAVPPSPSWEVSIVAIFEKLIFYVCPALTHLHMHAPNQATPKTGRNMLVCSHQGAAIKSWVSWQGSVARMRSRTVSIVLRRPAEWVDSSTFCRWHWFKDARPVNFTWMERCCRVVLFCWLYFICANVPGSTCSAEKLIMVVFEADEISVCWWKVAYLFSSGSLLFSCQSKYWASTSRFAGTSFCFFGFFFL